MKLFGLEIRRQRGETPAPPPPPAPAPIRPDPVEAYRRLMRARTVVLPVSGIEVRLARPTIRHLVDAGLTVLAMAPVDTEGISEAEMDMIAARIATQARRLFCVCAESPKFAVHPDDSKPVCDIMDLPDEDLMHAYGMLLEWGDSVFYGTHREGSGLSPADDYEDSEDPRIGWFDAQVQAAGFVDAVARTFGRSTEELDEMRPLIFARLCAYMEAGGHEARQGGGHAE